MKQLLARGARRAGFDGNPLRRRVDKIESAVLLGLVVAFLIAAPFLAIAAGRAADNSALREQRVLGTRAVPAVLQQSASAAQAGADGAWDASWVKAQWKAPDSGATRAGVIAAPLNARAGEREWIWVTPGGQLTSAPLSRSARVYQIVVAAAFAIAGLAAVLMMAGVILRMLAERRRLASWARGWAAVGSRWSPRR